MVWKIRLYNKLKSNTPKKELAELINTTQSCVARLESGKYNPSMRFLQKIADACDKKIEIKFIPKTC